MFAGGRVETRLHGLAARLLRAAGVAPRRAAHARGRARFLARHDVLDLVGLERLPLEQGPGQALDLLAVLLDDGARPGVLLIDDAADFPVHDLGHGVAHVLVRHHVAPEENLALVVAVNARAEHIAHAPAHDHAAREVGGALEVVGRAGGHLMHEYLFRDAAAHQHRDGRKQAFTVKTVTVLGGQLHGDAQRATARNDDHLLHRIGVPNGLRHHRVAGFVIRRVHAFLLWHDNRAALRAHHYFVLGLFEIFHVHEPLVGARAKHRRFIDEVREVRAGETGRATGNNVGVHIIRHRHLAHVHLENLLASANIGQRHIHLAIETTRTQQRRVEHVRTVGRGDHDHALGAFKAVHFHQQLVERLFAFVVTAAEAGAALTPDGIDFVDKNNAGRVFLRLLEHVAHARGADTDEHLDKVGTGNGEKRHLRLAGNGLGQQRLAGARGAGQEHALRYTTAQFLKLGRAAQELHELAHFFLGFLDTGDIVERDLVLLFAQHARLALAETHGAAAAHAALHLAHEENPHADEQQQPEPVDEDGQQQRLLFLRLAFELHLVVDEVVKDLLVARIVSGEALAALQLARDFAALDRDPLDLVAADLLDEGGIFQRTGGRLAVAEIVEHRHQHDGDDEPQQKIFREIVQALPLCLGARRNWRRMFLNEPIFLCRPLVYNDGNQTPLNPFPSRYISRLSARDACGLRNMSFPKRRRIWACNSLNPAP